MRSKFIKMFVIFVLLMSVFPNCMGKKDVLTIKPGKTSGKIYVGEPRIVARERLVNDRFEQKEWLAKELEDSEKAVFGFQGMLARENIFSRVMAANILADPKLAERFADELKIISFLQGTDAADDPNQTINAEQIKRLVAFFHDVNQVNTMPPTTLKGIVSASQNDMFFNRRDLREKIRAEYLDNALDDRHDLSGNNLYRMVFDTTVFPKNDTSAWAWIEVSVLDDSFDLNWNDLYQEWLRRLEEELKVATLSYMAVIKSEKKGENVDYIKGLSNLPDAIINDIAFAIQDENTKDAYEIGNNKITTNPQIFRATPGNEMPIYTPKVKKRMADYIFSVIKVMDNGGDHEQALRYIISRLLIYRYFGKYDLERFATPDLQNINNIYTIYVKPKPNGLRNFRCKLAEQCSNIFAYSVTPKETVEQIADSSAVSYNLENLFSIQFIFGEAAGEALTRYIKRQQAVYTAIKRQPLVVGFSSIDDHNGLIPPTFDSHNYRGSTSGLVHCRFGWIIGPRFGTTANGERAIFRHRNVQNAVAALVSLPPWWRYATLRVSTKWVKEDGSIMDGPWDQNDKIIKVRLPGNIYDITLALMADLPRSPLPLGCSIKDGQYLQAGKDVEILIIGEELWRSPAVTLGGQQAKSIRVLPSMKGIIAKFDHLKVVSSPNPGGDTGEPKEKAVKMDLRVWNGDGHSFVKEVDVLPGEAPDEEDPEGQNGGNNPPAT